MFTEFKTTYEYLRPPIDVLALEKQMYWFETENGVNGNKKDRLIFYDKSDWTTNEHEELQYWKKVLKEKDANLSDWWDNEEILRYMWTSSLGRDPDYGFTEGKTRVEWAKLFDNWLNKDLNYDLTNDQTEILKSGDVTIIGRDKYYRPVIYINQQSINDDNKEDYKHVIGKVVSIARTYMCIPTKVENTWIILNSEHRNNMSVLKILYEILQPLRLINRIAYSLVNINVGVDVHHIWQAIMAQGMIHESNMIRTQIVKSADEINFEILKELIDLRYLPKYLGGTRASEYPQTWPPNFPKQENYSNLINRSLMIKYNLKPFYFPCDVKSISKWFNLDKKRDYSQIIGVDSQMVKELNSKLLQYKRNDFYINMWSQNQLDNALAKERNRSNRVDAMVIFPSILHDINFDLQETRCRSTNSDNNSIKSVRSHKYNTLKSVNTEHASNLKKKQFSTQEQSANRKKQKNSLDLLSNSNKNSLQNETQYGLKMIEDDEKRKNKVGFLSSLFYCFKRD